MSIKFTPRMPTIVMVDLFLYDGLKVSVFNFSSFADLLIFIIYSVKGAGCSIYLWRSKRNFWSLNWSFQHDGQRRILKHIIHTKVCVNRFFNVFTIKRIDVLYVITFSSSWFTTALIWSYKLLDTLSKTPYFVSTIKNFTEIIQNKWVMTCKDHCRLFFLSKTVIGHEIHQDLKH